MVQDIFQPSMQENYVNKNARTSMRRNGVIRELCLLFA